MISLCITTYNRTSMLHDSFIKVVDDERISEIIIVDDHSDQEIFDKNKAFCSAFKKIRLERNPFRFGMQGNKRKAIQMASNPWAVIFDDDNELSKTYLDALYSNVMLPLDPKVIYCPDYAAPNFNYQKYGGMFITKKNVAKYMEDAMFRCCLNTCNYLVNTAEYLNVYEYDKEVKATDTIHFAYRWLSAGNTFFIVPGMMYYHRVHAGSGFKADMDYNMKDAIEMENIMRTLC